MKKLIKKLATNTPLIGVIVLVVLLGLLFTPDAGSAIGGSILYRVFKAIVMAATMLFIVWLSSVMRTLTKKGDLGNDPYAVLRGCVYIASAIIVVGAFVNPI